MLYGFAQFEPRNRRDNFGLGLKNGVRVVEKKLLKKTCGGRADLSKTPKLVEIDPVVAEFFATGLFLKKGRVYGGLLVPF